jgi:16S rRNA (cytosine967-C5)-methyltransferase
MTRAAGIEPRRAALTILQELRNGKPLEAALQQGLDTLHAPDRRLAHQLAAGVLRQRTVLDQRLSPLVPRGWHKVSPALQDILRLGAFQLIALDRVPPHAAVDTSVALARDLGGSKAGGFVNAVLRRLASEDSPAPVPLSPSALLAQRYSHPEWLVQRWIRAFGSAPTERLLEWNNTKPRLVLQPARAERSALAECWRRAGLEVESAPYGAGLLTDQSRPTQLPGYRDGSFIVQDPAQALLAEFASFPPGDTIYDACAAPGGKTIALGRSSATVLAGDVSRSRARRLAENLLRAGSGREHVVVADARMPPISSIRSVLLDAPCLGTGTFARHPDARWRLKPEALTTLQELQAELLESLAAIVEPGGLLVYSTCSLEPEENHLQIDRFLEHHPEFSRETAGDMSPSLLSEEGDLVLLPQVHGIDGAYAARLRRTA